MVIRKFRTIFVPATFVAVSLLCSTLPAMAKPQPPVDLSLYSTMPSTSAHRPEMTVDGDAGSYFESFGDMEGYDRFVLQYARPISIKSVSVITGDAGGKNLLTSGLLEASGDGVNFDQSVAFDKAGRAVLKGRRHRSIQSIRIRLAKDDSVSHLDIREIAVDTGVPLGHVEWASGRAVVDVSKAPDLAKWASIAQKEMEGYWPAINAMLYSDGYIPPNMINMVFQDGDGVAGTGGGEMLVNAKWCRENPTDYGLTVHEISHAVQCYPTYDNAWLVEGISDYVRWVKFQPKDFDWGLNLTKSTYHDSYLIGAGIWIYKRRRAHKALVDTED